MTDASAKVQAGKYFYRVSWADYGMNKGYKVYNENGSEVQSRAVKGMAISAFQREMSRLFAPGEDGMNARLDAVLNT